MKKFSKKLLFSGILATSFVCGIFMACPSSGGEDDTTKETVTVNVNSSSSDRVWFYAASSESSDIDASDVPYFDFSSVRNVTNNTVQPSSAKISSTLPTKLREYDENISQQNQEIAKALVNGKKARTTFSGTENVTKVFDSSVAKGSTTSIYLQKSNNDFEKETATNMYSGTYCNVFFVDNTSGKITADSLSSYKKDDDSIAIDIFETLGKLFDEKVYPNITNILGSFSYTTKYSDVIESPSKINIVVADCYYDYTKTESSGEGVQGYFLGADMLTEYPNQDAIIYLDSYFLNYNPETCYSTLAHEFNHMLNYINKTFSNKLLFSTWYTEMLSALADAMFENYLVSDLDEDDSIYMQRIPFFNTFYNLGFSNWRNTSNYLTSDLTSDIYISYGNVFAFGDFLAKNYGGFDLITEIATNSYVDEDSILYAVQKVQNDSSITFENIIKKFSSVIVNQIFTTKDSTLPTLNKKITYSTNDSIYLKAINIPTCYVKSDNSYFSGSGLNAISGKETVPLGQYGFVLFQNQKKFLFKVLLKVLEMCLLIIL